MPLKLVLRPGEKLIVNGAVIGIGDHPVSLFFYNKVNFLRGREILKEENCDTIEKRLYFIIQLIYIFPEDASTNMVHFAAILEEARVQHPDKADLFDEVQTLVREGNNYRALKLCRKLFDIKETAEAAPAPKPPVEVVRRRRKVAAPAVEE
ncbi:MULTISPECIES: flagellar biosynthesis repressor FlbT [Nitrospirillum]|uniref:Flagellar protein n=2 Tax=Nitrospirillum TaxID=1543705 RepID=A0A248JTH5_9PROT|nr:flagellar biosynthesis repressor FlbT [Nitrospirillum amazonense]ASG22033.1 flagellar protein [Nitrospirillum amazonense CBAmc]EGY00045.1 flagellar protein [Nitrospirillum amazonense Y2]TWB11577.1 flagellar protein FlbT [Nitrospirillum amazonense]TWB39812.1 flagellar protein FlbT [Nitrospirillum amazonense]TWB64157.1 flagellar protein FlbT [Nitrospirillum amazonense]